MGCSSHHWHPADPGAQPNIRVIAVVGTVQSRCGRYQDGAGDSLVVRAEMYRAFQSNDLELYWVQTDMPQYRSVGRLQPPFRDDDPNPSFSTRGWHRG